MAIVRYRDGNGNIVPLRVIQGEDGKQMFVRFSAHADGTDMSEVWDASRNYMGITFGDVAPTDKSGYQWIYITSSEALDEAVADLREEIATHTITADRVTDLTEFMVDYQTAKIVTGTYDGDGDGTVSITFPFAPKLVLACGGGSYQTMMMLMPQTLTGVGSVSGNGKAAVTLQGTTVTWKGRDLAGSADEAGVTYSYVAFG